MSRKIPGKDKIKFEMLQKILGVLLRRDGDGRELSVHLFDDLHSWLTDWITDNGEQIDAEKVAENTAVLQELRLVRQRITSIEEHLQKIHENNWVTPLQDEQMYAELWNGLHAVGTRIRELPEGMDSAVAKTRRVARVENGKAVVWIVGREACIALNDLTVIGE